MLPSVTINPPLSPGNTRGVPFTDYVFTSSQAWAVPWDAVALRVCTIGAGGTGGAVGPNGASGGGAGSGFIANGAKADYYGTPAALSITVPAAGSGGAASVTGAGFATVSAAGGGHGAQGVGNNQGTGASGGAGGAGGAGGGGGAGGLFTATHQFGNQGQGGNGHNSSGSAGSYNTNNGGNGGAYGGPNGPTNHSQAISTQAQSVFRPFGDTSVPIFLYAAGGNAAAGAWSVTTHAAGCGGTMASLPSGSGYGRGGYGMGSSENWRVFTPQGQGAVVIRAFWE